MKYLITIGLIIALLMVFLPISLHLEEIKAQPTPTTEIQAKLLKVRLNNKVVNIYSFRDNLNECYIVKNTYYDSYDNISCVPWRR